MFNDPAFDGNGQWLSAHLFHSGGIYASECDDILLDVITPFVQQAEAAIGLRRWFFVRYGEGGPHVRLRLLPYAASAERPLRNLLCDAARAQNATIVVDEFPSTSEVASNRSIVTNLCWVAYEPEVERYGGAAAIELAEDSFHRSSCTAIEVVRRTRVSRSARLARGLLATLAAMYAFFPTRSGVCEFARRYATGYLRQLTPLTGETDRLLAMFREERDRQSDVLAQYIEETLKCLETAESLPVDLARIHGDMQNARSQLADLSSKGVILQPSWWRASAATNAEDVASYAYVIPSYVHMMNNRLGIGIPEEAFLAFLIHQTIAQLTAGTGANSEIQRD